MVSTEVCFSCSACIFALRWFCTHQESKATIANHVLEKHTQSMSQFIWPAPHQLWRLNAFSECLHFLSSVVKARTKWSYDNTRSPNADTLVVYGVVIHADIYNAWTFPVALPYQYKIIRRLYHSDYQPELRHFLGKTYQAKWQIWQSIFCIWKTRDFNLSIWCLNPSSYLLLATEISQGLYLLIYSHINIENRTRNWRLSTCRRLHHTSRM